jgi:hypothetical protein
MKELRQCGLEEGDARRFCDSQWCFAAVVFDFESILPRIFDESAVLPFPNAGNTYLIHPGGFGDVYEATIDPQHQQIPFKVSELILRVPTLISGLAISAKSVLIG